MGGGAGPHRDQVALAGGWTTTAEPTTELRVRDAAPTRRRPRRCKRGPGA
ncbi:hypothetical protein QJS66_13540 [Kocuria rhizophila]|nr:hypothetical protein QJS66_13540 [Kocuria rhizophila]